MKIAVVGSGYVGLMAGACLAESGNDVICADIDQGKIDGLNRGEIPIFEPGLEPLIESNLEAARLSFSTDVPEAVRASEIVFIAVGTPPDEDGSADLQHVLAVARTIGESMNGEKIRKLQRGVVKALPGLAPEDRFQLISFSDSPRRLTPRWMQVSQASVGT